MLNFIKFFIILNFIIYYKLLQIRVVNTTIINKNTTYFINFTTDIIFRTHCFPCFPEFCSKKWLKICMFF